MIDEKSSPLSNVEWKTIGEDRSQNSEGLLFDCANNPNPDPISTNISKIDRLKLSSMEEVTSLISSRGSIIKADKLRLDLIRGHFERGGVVEFSPEMPLKNLRLEQGWEREGVLSIINSIATEYGISTFADINDVSKEAFLPFKEAIQNDLPPLIVRAWDDDLIEVEDGNHRWGACLLMGIECAPAFVMISRK